MQAKQTKIIPIRGANKGKNKSSTSTEPKVIHASKTVPSTTKPPKVLRSNEGLTVVSNCEFIGSVSGSSDFSILTYSINPGLSAVFPWLSTMANSMNGYEFETLRFIYRTRASSTVQGSIIMGFNPDASDSSPTTEANLGTLSGTVEDAARNDLILNIPSSILKGKRFIRSSRVSFADIKTYDILNFYLATVGMSGTDITGKLWVEYRVKLSSPLTPTLSLNNPKSSSLYTYSATSWTSGTPVPSFTTVADGLGIGDYNSNQFSLPVGYYRLTVSYHYGFTPTALSLLDFGVRVYSGGDLQSFSPVNSYYLPAESTIVSAESTTLVQSSGSVNLSAQIYSPDSFTPETLYISFLFEDA